MDINSISNENEKEEIVDLISISTECKNNLDNFFKNEDVIEIIYRKQYGDAYYEKNKATCKKNFEEIMKNTVFIPYVTMEHLEEFLFSIRLTQGDQYLIDNYSKELKLIKKLHNEKKTIIKKYSSFMLDELDELIQYCPDLDRYEYNKMLKNFPNISFKNIQSLFSENKPGFFQKLKRKKIEKCIEKYKKLTNDKITAETSSYYKHISDIPYEKYYANILEGIQAGDTGIIHGIGRKSDRNIRYIFLPVLAYKNKKQYLEFALHEVMHLSKEKIHKNKYKTGIWEATLPINSNKSILYLENYVNAPLSDIASEEIMNDWQSCEAVLEILENQDLSNLFKMRYNLENISPEESINSFGHYESFNNYTKPFMEKFGSNVQEVNNGNLSVKKFKKSLGKTNGKLNFDIFSNEANNCIENSEAHSYSTYILSNKSSSNAKNIVAESALMNMIEYSNILQAKAEERAAIAQERADKRAALLNKVKAFMTKDLSTVLKEYDEYFANKTKNQHQNIHYPEAR